MKKSILSFIVALLFSPAICLAGPNFDVVVDVPEMNDMTKMSRYNFMTAYNLTGEDSYSLTGALVDPMLMITMDGEPFMSFMSVGPLLGVKTSGSSQQNLFFGVNIVQIRWLAIGFNRNMTNGENEAFVDGFELHAGFHIPLQ